MPNINLSLNPKPKNNIIKKPQFNTVPLDVSKENYIIHIFFHLKTKIKTWQRLIKIKNK